MLIFRCFVCNNYIKKTKRRKLTEIKFEIWRIIYFKVLFFIFFNIKNCGMDFQFSETW